MVNMIQLPSGLHFLRECRPNGQPLTLSSETEAAALSRAGVGLGVDTSSRAHPDHCRAWGSEGHGEGERILVELLLSPKMEGIEEEQSSCLK